MDSDEKVRVVLYRLEPAGWQIVIVDEGVVVGHLVFYGHESVALLRAQQLAQWFDAELVTERIGA